MKLTTQQIKEIVSHMITHSGANGAANSVIHKIIFSEASLDWNHIWNIVLTEMPEFQNETYLKSYIDDIN